MPIYLVAQTLYKLVPAFDRVLLPLLRDSSGRSGKGLVVIRHGHPQPKIHERIAQRRDPHAGWVMAWVGWVGVWVVMGGCSVCLKCSFGI